MMCDAELCVSALGWNWGCCFPNYEDEGRLASSGVWMEMPVRIVVLCSSSILSREAFLTWVGQVEPLPAGQYKPAAEWQHRMLLNCGSSALGSNLLEAPLSPEGTRWLQEC